MFLMWKRGVRVKFVPKVGYHINAYNKKENLPHEKALDGFVFWDRLSG